MNGQNQLEDELQTRVLSDVSFIETFAVELDARNVMGCQGPPLDYSKDSKKTDLLWSLVERGIHVRKACKTSDSDIEMEIRMNNYLDFLKPDARKRFRWLLQREKNQSFTRSWQCCTPCEHTQPSANDAARNGAAHTHEEESANKKAATTVSREAADPSSSSIKTFKFSGQPPMQCPYCQFSSKKVRSFVNHLSQCEKADPSIRAKTQPIPSIGCVYGCKLSLQRYDQHDRELHYLCGCQKFIDRRSQTRTHRCDDPDQHQAWVAIDPVQYFTFKILKNRAESPRPDSQVHEDEKQSSDSVECSGSMRSSQDNHRIELQPDTLSNTTQGLSHEHFVGNTNHTGMVRMNSVASTTSPRTRLSSMFSIGDQPTTVAESPDCSASITDADSIGSHGEARSSAATPMASGSVSLVDPVVTRRRKLSVTSAGTKMADTINVNTNFNIDDVEVAIFGSGSALRQNDSSPPCDPLSLEGSEFSSKRSVDDDPVASPQGTKRAKLGGTRSFSVHEAGNSTIESSQHMSQLVELSASLDSDAAVSRSARECFSATPGKPGDIHQVFERNDKIKANQQHIPINSSLEQAEGTPNMETSGSIPCFTLPETRLQTVLPRPGSRLRQAIISRMEYVFGTRLTRCILSSRARQIEDSPQFTEAVFLKLASTEGDDFELEASLGSSERQEIIKAVSSNSKKLIEDTFSPFLSSVATSFSIATEDSTGEDRLLIRIEFEKGPVTMRFLYLENLSSGA